MFKIRLDLVHVVIECPLDTKNAFFVIIHSDNHESWLNTIKSQRSVVDSIIILPIVFWKMAYPYGQLLFAVSHCSAVKQVWLSGFDLPRQKVDR